MKQAFKAVQISEHVYWVGAIDFSLREFHGYATQRGTTYNAYLVVGEKVTLIDTVKAPYKGEMLARISSVTEPDNIDVIISNHSEMDHSGCLAEVIDLVQPESVLASAKGVEALREHFGLDCVEALADGESLGVGDLTLSFYETRMLHWPDSMFTYLHADGILFSQDGFGMHLASFERFADELDPPILEYEAAKYYANILLPYSNLVSKTLERVSQSGLDIRMVAPDHGPIWRKDIPKVLDWYAKWADQKPTCKALVVYDTMWHSTELMAKAIGEGVSAGGARALLLPLAGSHRSDVATQLLDAGALVVGSPTMNNNIFPTLSDVLTYIKGLRPKNLIGAAFGSYGWGGEANKQLLAVLEEMKVQLVGEAIKAKYVPDEAALGQCYELGLQIAAKLKEVVGNS